MTRFTGAELPPTPRRTRPAKRGAGPALRHTRPSVARFILRVFQSAFVRRLGHGMARLADAGTSGYPPDVKRRLKSLNLIAYLIAISTLVYALQQARIDFAMYAPVIYVNLALVVVACLVPFAHRISDIAGGLLIVIAEYVAQMSFTAFFGRDAGTPLHYIVAAAAVFVVFGLQRIWLVLCLVVLALVLHVVAWFAFPHGRPFVTPDVANANYIQGAITTFGLIAASVYYAFSLVERAKAETDRLLRNILPDSVVERLKVQPGEPIADSFAEATVLFADISGFVPLARQLGPQQVVALLNRIVMGFDALAQRHGVVKIKTIGDAYMAVAGLPDAAPDHARRIAAFAFDMLAHVERVSGETSHPISIRIGMATGPVMAGVIGTDKFSYDVWGDTVNMASRLESLGAPGRIHICPGCRQGLDEHYAFESRGLIEVKGLGPVETWYLRHAITAGRISEA
jgi:adenylate cyclase